MKNMKKILLAVLAVILVVAFAGCGIAKKDDGGNAGGGSPIPAPQPSGDITGTYHGVYDITDQVAASLKEELAEYNLNPTGQIVMNLTLTLNSDDSYSLDFDVTQFLADTRAYYEGFFPDMIKAIFETDDMNEIESMLQGIGYGGFDEYLAEMVDVGMESVESQYEGMTTEEISAGTYTVDGDTLKLSETSGDRSVTGNATINSDGSIAVEANIEGGGVGDIIFTK